MMMTPDIDRRSLVQGATALGTLAVAGAASAQHAQQERAGGALPSADPHQPYIGAGTPRIDGRAKVTGTAKYAAEFEPSGLVHAQVVTSSITKGRITAIDTAQALAVEGVISVLTHENRPRMADSDEAYNDDVAPEDGKPFRPLYDATIRFNGQPVALVIASDSDTARFAASLVRVNYEAAEHNTDLHKARGAAVKKERPSKPRGNARDALSKADIRHEAEYTIPVEHHNPMELFGTTVEWHDDGTITVYDKTQGVQNVQRYIAHVFDMQPDDVRVVSHYMGGGFGAGLRPQYNVALAVLAARAVKRSVRLYLTREQMYGLSFRPETIERVALGAGKDGKLQAITHEAIAMTSQYEDFLRNDIGWADQLYACQNVDYAHRLARLDLPTPGDMRAPGAATGVYALESAMDELAIALKLDPVQLRLLNYSDTDQAENLPYTSKQLRECYSRAAEAFGWSKRSPQPRSMRDGKELVGWGMATGVWEALQMPFAVRLVLTANGHAEVACATHDIGTGTYTIMAQVAADVLGLPIDNIAVKLGDSSLPMSPVSGGSWTAVSIGTAILKAGAELRGRLLGLAQSIPGSPLADAKPGDVELRDGKIVSKRDPGRAVSIAEVMQKSGMPRIEIERHNEFEKDEKHARNTHAAVFAEVKVDEELGVIRVTRLVSAVAAGRIINTKTAHSQIMGSLIWGIGMALHEETLIDHRFGRVTNANIAEYHVPVNADVYDIDVIFVEEPDDIINPLGSKGVGEIGIVGVAAAIANAVHHATGKRVRNLPITLDKLL